MKFILFYVTLRYIVLHRVASRCITSHHIISHHITSHHIISPHITLHYITFHYITLLYMFEAGQENEKQINQNVFVFWVFFWEKFGIRGGGEIAGINTGLANPSHPVLFMFEIRIASLAPLHDFFKFKCRNYFKIQVGSPDKNSRASTVSQGPHWWTSKQHDQHLNPTTTVQYDELPTNNNK